MTLEIGHNLLLAIVALASAVVFIGLCWVARGADEHN